MSRRYDSRTTTFSPDGRLHQVEYAMEAINNAGSTVGILGKNCVVLAGEKKSLSKLLEGTTSIPPSQFKNNTSPISSCEKMFKIDSHIICAVAGITSDSNILLYKLRQDALNFRKTYGTDIEMEQLVSRICDVKQSYTQYGGLRPFGVSFLFAGIDEDNTCQLYHTDPAGNFSAWKAYAVGSNSSAAQSVLRSSWKEGMTMEECLELAVKVLMKTTDSVSLDYTKFEIACIFPNEAKERSHIQKVLDKDEISSLVEKTRNSMDTSA